MDDKYRILKRRLNEIHNKMRNLRNNDDSVKNVLNDNILFDGTNPVKGKMASIRESINDIDDTLVYSVIPRVSRKIGK